jgi:two-component system, OmpR family, sensor histidine kinase MtrB
MRLSLVGRVTVLASAVALAVGVMFVAALVAILSLRASEAKGSHSKDVTVATLRVQNLAVDIESAVRGYALSGDRRFLDLYNAATSQLPSAVKDLRNLTQDDSVQSRRAASAQTQLDQYLSDYAQPVIQLAQIARSQARGEAASLENERRASGIRSSLSAITQLENDRASQRAAHTRTVTRAAIGASIGALAVSAGLVLLFGAWVARRVARPVRETTAAAAEVAAGDFEIRLDENAAGEVGALVSAFNSMTRSLELGRREVLMQNEQLRESEQHKRDLISMVSHEVRTPLASVLGFTALLLERDFSPEEQRRYLEIVDAQARRLAGLAGDFLDVQLLEGGAMTLNRGPVDLGDLAREQARLFFSHSDSHRLELDVPDEPVVVDGDRDRLAQVVGNLYSNAIKYSPAGGVIRVELRPNGSHVVLAVEDEGMGIAPEDQERVFDKFFRSAEASAGIGGTGLGLAVAREIVETHGGSIDVRSQPGEGSRFWIDLPVHAPAPSPVRS